MKKNKSIQFKAAILLLTFSLNMVVGFACAIGINLGYKNSHHHDTIAVKVHTHANGQKHEHTNKVVHHHEKSKNNNSEKNGGCCNDTVIKISKIEKAIPQSSIASSLIFFTSYIKCYYNLDTFYPSQNSDTLRYFLQNYHPPIADIRIAIQSFLI